MLYIGTLILCVLFKCLLLKLILAQGTKQGVQFQEQFQSDLKLTMDWNRCDLAESLIFRKYSWKSIKVFFIYLVFEYKMVFKKGDHFICFKNVATCALPKQHNSYLNLEWNNEKKV